MSCNLTEQTKSVYISDITVSLIYCVFGSKITMCFLNFVERMDLFIVVYQMTLCKPELLNLFSVPTDIINL